MINDYHPVLTAIERDIIAKTEAVRAELLRVGRSDLVADLDAKLRDIRTGVMRARAIWHSITPAQRRVLNALASCRYLQPFVGSQTRYDAVGETHTIYNVCGIATITPLVRRRLLVRDGEVGQRFVLTEHGRFVVNCATYTIKP